MVTLPGLCRFIIQTNNQHEKKIEAAGLNRMLQELNETLQPAEKQLHELVKRCNQVNRILEHAALEEDMEWKDRVVFHGSTHQFLTLLAPLIKSEHCKVDGKSNREALLRALDEVIKVCPEEGKEPLKFSSLLDAAKRYLSDE
ncbi:hypothetical protein H8784_19675 [Parabacteroides acidifaciens]|uniref:Uncharacterized protein n=2 Tax=Parabacteroides TaxID=375288 RepID=A0A3D8H8M4_9BACT|nr:hypothetical protein [Parabacteroides acidifaciens]MBC8603928.1 hypothetical protein [Parabacteroides acidifaciens]RDU47326.1 hypothetical protein DWU89_20195 [Parabacteroides acidifaciens]